MKETKDDANGKAFCAHVFEDLTLLKFLYYSKWSTDLMQSLFFFLNPVVFFYRSRKIQF